MVLDTLPEMAGAIALYRRHGFVETARYWDCPVERTIYLESLLLGRVRVARPHPDAGVPDRPPG